MLMLARNQPINLTITDSLAATKLTGRTSFGDAQTFRMFGANPQRKRVRTPGKRRKEKGVGIEMSKEEPARRHRVAGAYRPRGGRAAICRIRKLVIHLASPTILMATPLVRAAQKRHKTT